MVNSDLCDLYLVGVSLLFIMALFPCVSSLKEPGATCRVCECERVVEKLIREDVRGRFVSVIDLQNIEFI